MNFKKMFRLIHTKLTNCFKSTLIQICAIITQDLNGGNRENELKISIFILMNFPESTIV